VQFLVFCSPGDESEECEESEHTIGQRWKYFERSVGLRRLSKVCTQVKGLLASLSFHADNSGACLSFHRPTSFPFRLTCFLSYRLTFFPFLSPDFLPYSIA
jgi:hypothetical protein